MSYHEACSEVEDVWDKVKNCPYEAREACNAVENELYTLRTDIRDWQESAGETFELPEFEKPVFHQRTLLLATTDPLEVARMHDIPYSLSVLYERTIFAYIGIGVNYLKYGFEYLGALTKFWINRVKLFTTFGERVEKFTDELEEFEWLSGAAEDYIDTVRDNVKEWEEGVEDLAHAFHAMPDDDALLEEYNNHDDCYSQDDLDEAVANAEVSGLPVDEVEFLKDSTNDLFYLFSDPNIESSWSNQENVNKLWAYLNTGNSNEERKHGTARFKRLLFAMRDAMQEISPEHRKAITDFLDIHSDAVAAFIERETNE